MTYQELIRKVNKLEVLKRFIENGFATELIKKQFEHLCKELNITLN